MTTCNKKNWIVSSLVVAVGFFLLEWVFHGMLMMDRYVETMALWRPAADMQGLQWVGWAGYLLFSFLFTCLFAKGYEAGKSKVGQGVRFGFFIGLFYVGTNLLTMVPYTPIPSDIIWCWFGIGMSETILLGALTGFLYKAN